MNKGDPDGLLEAEMRRGLILAGNIRGNRFDGKQIAHLIGWAFNTYGLAIVKHPSFPWGVVSAYKAAYSVDSKHVEKVDPKS